MADVRACARRYLALGLLALAPAPPAAWPAQPALPQAVSAVPPAARSAAPLFIVNDGHGRVTVIAEQASVREVVLVLSRWFDLSGLDVQAIPDTLAPMRFERVAVNEVLDGLLESAGVPAPPARARARHSPAARSSAPLFVVHDGRGLITAGGDQAAIPEMLALLSRWFDFPIVNPDAIPNVRVSMRFERVTVAQVVDSLLRGASVNYVMMTNPQTLVPSKVLAGARGASTAVYQPDPRGQAGRAALIPALPGRMDSAQPVGPQLPGAPGGYDRPFRLEDLPVLPVPQPTDPATATDTRYPPVPPVYPSLPPFTLESNPSPQTPKTPSASRPGAVVPAAPPTLPGGKPPGPPAQ